jgi:hypothetical protein
MPDDDVNEVDLKQQNVGPAGQTGGGEWPSPDTPPTGPAPGQSTRSDEGSAGFKEVLEADPEVGGSGSTPHDDIPEDRESSPDPSAGGP